LLRDANLSAFWEAKHRTFKVARMRAHLIFLITAIAAGCSISLPTTVFPQQYRERGNNKEPAPLTFGDYAARKFLMWIGSWLACGETLRNSAIVAARYLHNATRPPAVRIAIMSRGRYDRDYGPRRNDRDYGPRPYDRDYGQKPYYGPRPYDDFDE
jgi:hypothetical protein